jgi:flagellar basal-body rod protein FlgB
MDFNDIPLLSMIRGRLGYLNERQRLIAQNVANADTPGYTPADLKPFTVAKVSAAPLALAPVAAAPAVTSPAQIALPVVQKPADPWQPQNTPDSETRLDGNQVVLEEEMMKMNDSRMNYNAAIDYYEQSMNMIQTAIRLPGK